jgi:hypothetical protein
MLKKDTIHNSNRIFMNLYVTNNTMYIKMLKVLEVKKSTKNVNRKN